MRILLLSVVTLVIILTIFLGRKDVSTLSKEKATPPSQSYAEGRGTQAFSGNLESRDLPSNPIQFDTFDKRGFPFKKHWFKRPTLASEGRFLVKPKPFEARGECQSINNLSDLESLEAYFEHVLGVDTSVRSPKSYHISSLTQFWEHEGWYYQITARWQNNFPPSYFLEYYRFNNPDLHGTPELVTSMVPTNETVDVLSAQNYIREELATAESIGANPGASIIEGQVTTGENHDPSTKVEEDSKNLNQFTLLNGKVVNWSQNSGLTCQTEDSKVVCHCRM